MNTVAYFDIHSHLNDKRFDEDRAETISEMENAGVATIVVGTDRKMSQDATKLAEKYQSIHAVVGLHPTDTDEDFDEDFYRELLEHPKTVGVGECGLDYFHGEDTSEEKKRQKKLFEKQLELSVRMDKPLMIHCRDAHIDLLDMLESKKREYGDRLRGNVHFFTGSTDIAKRYYDMDFTTSFTGVLTFTQDYDDVVRFAPLSMIMSETDAPYVAPVPYRGRRNKPLYVLEVVEKIAEIRGEDLEKVQKTLVENAFRVFGIKYN